MLGVAGAIAVALAAVVFLSPHKPPAPMPALAASPALAAAAPGAAKLQHLLAQQSNEIRRLKKEKTALLDELGQHIDALAKPEPPPAPAAPAAGGGAVSRMAGMSKMVAVAARQQADRKLAALKTRLHLTDEQAAAVEELLKKQTDRQVEMASKMFEGKLTQEDMASQPKLDFDGQLKSMLSPDQWTGYQQYKTEEQQRQVQMASQAEMMQISSMLQLSDQQREQVSSVLQQQYQQYITQQSDSSLPTTDSAKLVDQMFESKKEALRSVLTADQMQSYEKFIESQREMVRSFMPQASPKTTP